MSDATATAAAPAVKKTDDAAAIIEPTQTATMPADDAGAKRTRAAVVKAGETAKRASAPLDRSLIGLKTNKLVRAQPELHSNHSRRENFL